MIEVVVPRSRPRLWQIRIIERLRAAGHAVKVTTIEAPGPWSWLAERIIALESALLRPGAKTLAAIVGHPSQNIVSVPPELRLDLTGHAGNAPIPSLCLAFDGGQTAQTALDALAGGHLPNLTMSLDGQVVAEAAPMIDKRASIALGLEDVLARAITLSIATVDRFSRDRLSSLEPVARPVQRPAGLLVPYLFSMLPRMVGELIRRRRFHFAHWRVGYRFSDRAGGHPDLGGSWLVLPDDGTRFFADPFAFEWDGRNFIFVEDYPHATGKAVISVVEIGADGIPGEARVVLEESCHLSYPQVFARDGRIWMIPESSGSRQVVLYRAEAFPDRWVRHAVLIDGRELSDATLCDYGGKLWLFATDRDGYGSTSDTLVVYHAETLTDPWLPHGLNPIVIDRTTARPGGAFLKVGGRVLLPVQDGTLGYGGGLGFVEIEELSETVVRRGVPRPVSDVGDWPYPQVHTYNRAGRLEVIDGIACVRRR